MTTAGTDHGLKQAKRQVVDMPFDTVSASLARILGFTQSVHTLERNQREMATAVEDFWTDQGTPPAKQEGEILVCTADRKGVPMRSEYRSRFGAGFFGPRRVFFELRQIDVGGQL